ncbi:MAG: hypothetical protein J1E39_00240 [Eubacterium sp.]|nr:hypothetical protein [Eubacterium sp.]
MPFSIEHRLFSQKPSPWQLPELQPPQVSFSAQRQQANPQRAIPNSLFICISFHCTLSQASAYVPYPFAS